MTNSLLTAKQISDFQQDGAVCLPGLFSDWVAQIARGIEHNKLSPGPFAAENVPQGEPGRFFDDYCNWQRIPEFREFIYQSNVGQIAAQLMASDRAQLFHDHVLVKEAATLKATPWHQDAPYYFTNGMQNVSLWIPIDPVAENTLRFIAGSHHWPKFVLPTRWLSNKNFYADTEDYLPVPDPDNSENQYEVLEWDMVPGDAVAFHFRTVHGARGNNSTKTRRALSLRFVGDDARYITRPGRTSPPFEGHEMKDGDQLRQDWFPIIYPHIVP